jgi:drug/metabolite transporter (DMT)-like permease
MTYKNPYNFKILLLRSQLLTLYFVVFALTQFYLPQPIIQTINSCGPIFIFVLDYLINGVKITKSQSIGVLLAIIGVLITINGDYILELIIKR